MEISCATAARLRTAGGARSLALQRRDLAWDAADAVSRWVAVVVEFAPPAEPTTGFPHAPECGLTQGPLSRLL